MRPSMWSSYLVELSPEKMVETFAEHGWEFSELSDEHGWMLLGREAPGKAGRKFKNFAAARGVSFPQGHFYLAADIAVTRGVEREKLKDDLKKWCDLFNALEVKAGVLHPGITRRYTKKGARGEAVSRAAELLAEMLEYSRGASFMICLENLILEFNSFEDLKFLIDSVPGGGQGLGICLDTGHLNMNGGDCAEFVNAAAGRLRALHVSDSIGPGQDHILPFGAGNVDWEKLVTALEHAGYNGLFNLEVPRENKCPMEIRLKKLDYAKALAEKMLGMGV